MSFVRPDVNEGTAALVNARLLLVDDEPENIRLLERILRGAGFINVRSTTDSREVEALIQEFSPDLVLLDLRMPFRDGLEILEKLETLIRPTDFLPVVVLTSDGSPSTRELALERGAADYLTKPFDRTEVILRVQNLVHRRMMYVQLLAENKAMARDLQQQATERWHDQELRRRRRQAVADVIAAGGPRMVFQPIYYLDTGRLAGVEALARFDNERRWTPDRWFIEADAHGLGIELELLAASNALRAMPAVPGDGYLALNFSPDAVLTTEVDRLVHTASASAVIELTEHTSVTDYPRLTDELAHLHASGALVAIDDAGSGYSTLRHILRIAPDIIKLDQDLTRDIDRDPARRALASALIGFASDTGARVVAEGIETPAALNALRALGADCGQGYVLSRPVDAADIPNRTTCALAASA